MPDERVAVVEMDEAQAEFSALVERVEGGEQIVLTRRGKPAVRLVPVRQGNGFASLAGAWQGRVKIGEDFDELPAALTGSIGTNS